MDLVSTKPFVTARGERGRVTLVRLRHPRAFQTQNEITSLCFVSKHLVHKFHGEMGSVEKKKKHSFSLGMCDE